MTHLPHENDNRKPVLLIVHYRNDAAPVREPYSPKHLSEYVAAGFRHCLNLARDECHLIHPHAPYSARA
mgnify:FL=1|jgi:hypothetical protein